MEQLNIDEMEYILVALMELKNNYAIEGRGTEAIDISDVKYKIANLTHKLRLANIQMSNECFITLNVRL